MFSRELGFPVTWWNRLVLKVLKRAGFPVIPFRSMEEPEFLTEIEKRILLMITFNIEFLCKMKGNVIYGVWKILSDPYISTRSL